MDTEHKHSTFLAHEEDLEEYRQTQVGAEQKWQFLSCENQGGPPRGGDICSLKHEKEPDHGKSMLGRRNRSNQNPQGGII